MMQKGPSIWWTFDKNLPTTDRRPLHFPDRYTPTPTPHPYKATFVKGPPNPLSFWRERGSQHEGRNIRPLHNAGTSTVYLFPNTGANVATLHVATLLPAKRTMDLVGL